MECLRLRIKDIDFDELQLILADRRSPYYEHEVMAA
jgi:hypothetical protein